MYRSQKNDIFLVVQQKFWLNVAQVSSVFCQKVENTVVKVAYVIYPVDVFFWQFFAVVTYDKHTSSDLS